MTGIKTALDALLNDQATPLDQAIDRHFHSDYRQRTNGVWDDRAGFTAHIEHLRTIVKVAAIDVVDEISAGEQYADRHIVDIEKRDGTHVVQEVYLFGERAPDGRFLRIEEVTLMLVGAEEDRGLGSAR